MLPGEPEKVPEQFVQIWGRHRTLLAIMTSSQGAEEINICLNRLDDFQPEIKPFFPLSLIRLCTAGRAWLMQQQHSQALCPHQMLPRQADSASCTCHSQEDTQGRQETPLRNGTAGSWHRRGLQSWICIPKGQSWSLRDPFIHKMLHLALFAQGKGRKKVCRHDDEKSEQSKRKAELE